MHRFFNTYHKEQYLIFNLCAERGYNVDLFNGRVERILVEDREPPPPPPLPLFCA